MLGAIIGDVAGSIYEVLEVRELKNGKIRSYEERIKIMNEETHIFTPSSSVTDDSILTYAIYSAIKDNSKDYAKYLKYYGLKELNLGQDKYNRSRFGKGFKDWLLDKGRTDSYGNGASMRISPVGFMFDTLEEVKTNTYLVTIPSHNSSEALLGAEAVSTSIFLLRNGYLKDEVKEYVINNYYNLDYDLEDLRHNYKFSSRTSLSVPVALYCFFESKSFTDSLRKSLSIGGDSDTIACISSSLAEAYYGIPDDLIEEVKPYLRDYMQDIILTSKKYQKERKNL